MINNTIILIVTHGLSLLYLRFKRLKMKLHLTDMAIRKLSLPVKGQVTY